MCRHTAARYQDAGNKPIAGNQPRLPAPVEQLGAGRQQVHTTDIYGDP